MQAAYLDPFVIKRIDAPRKKDCYIFLVGASVALVYLVGVPPGVYLVSIPLAQ